MFISYTVIYTYLGVLALMFIESMQNSWALHKTHKLLEIQHKIIMGKATKEQVRNLIDGLKE